jgi:hypothetical protein
MPEQHEGEPMERPANGLMALSFGVDRPELPDVSYSLDQMELTRRVLALTADVESLRAILRTLIDTQNMQRQSIDNIGATVQTIANRRVA